MNVRDHGERDDGNDRPDQAVEHVPLGVPWVALAPKKRIR
jgi:hypothetical protein